MLISIIAGALLVVAGTAYLLRRNRRNKFKAECAKVQAEAARKVILDREAIERIREKVREELPHADPSMIVHHFDIDENGRDLLQRLNIEMPDAPEPQLYPLDMKAIDCPEFFGYKIKGPENKAA